MRAYFVHTYPVLSQVLPITLQLLRYCPLRRKAFYQSDGTLSRAKHVKSPMTVHGNRRLDG